MTLKFIGTAAATACAEYDTLRLHTITIDFDRIANDQTYYNFGNETEIKYEIMTRGPVVATYKVYRDFDYYRKGVYIHKEGEVTGYFRIRRGENHCDIEKTVVVGVPKCWSPRSIIINRVQIP
ncbi:hypothetical protein ANCCEY_10058 [Ancylostoma ceylanicum]|uniref:Peptidase C1A papain C-terminal domain-containing protein n=1 Tax=Ancylostoma ceylanicum TaxID=53326 RepID=A0A0D6LT91_9BILA|nr:hypothetical protein ANCCEY_10058 [Ancylostoma ceylanicum]